MSTTLSQRLRDLRNGLFPDIETVNAVLDKAIAQAEAQEGQAGELSDEEIKRILNANTYEDLNDSRQGGFVTSSDHDAYDMGMIAGLKYARDHGYLKPSQAIGEQTPVASAPVCMGCFSQEAVCRQPGLCVSGRPKRIPSEVYPEAREGDRGAGKCEEDACASQDCLQKRGVRQFRRSVRPSPFRPSWMTYRTYTIESTTHSP